MKHLLFYGLTLTLVLAGCASESTTPTQTPSNYTPSTSGSYYIHNNTTFAKTDGGSDSTISQSSDSTVVEGPASKTDTKGTTKSGVKLVVFSEDTAAATEKYFAQEDAKLYQLLSLQYDISGSPIDLGTAWVLIDDQNNATWVAYEDSITGMTINLGLTEAPLSVKIKIGGRKVGSESLTIDGQSVATKRSALEISITFYTNYGGFPLSIPVTFTIDQWFAANIGLVQSVQPPFKITIPILGNQDVEGNSSVVTRYSIK